jgi:hypothetical protein
MGISIGQHVGRGQCPQPATPAGTASDVDVAGRRGVTGREGARPILKALSSAQWPPWVYFVALGDDTVGELIARGLLRRVRVPARVTAERANGEVRRILLDRLDLDAQSSRARYNGRDRWRGASRSLGPR